MKENKNCPFINRKPVKWTNEKVMEVLIELYDWLLEEEEYTNKDGKTIIRPNSNVYYRYFLIKKGIHESMLGQWRMKPQFKDTISYLDDIQEMKLVILASDGRIKEGITKFVLENKHNWKNKTENINTNLAITWEEVKTYKKDGIDL